MEYLLMYHRGDDPQPYDPTEDDIAAWVAGVQARGAGKYGERLRPSQDATTVRVRGGQLIVTEGPFTESKEWVGGIDIISVPDLDAALDIASRHPAARFASVEVRPFLAAPDAGTAQPIVPPDFDEREQHGKRYVMFVCVDPTGEPGGNDPEAWVREMDGRDVRIFGEALRPPEDATQVCTRAGKVIVTDGPFTEAKEWIAGLDLLEVADLHEAIEVASRHPMAVGGVLVLSPVWPFDVHDDHVARTERERAEADIRTEPRVGASV